MYARVLFKGRNLSVTRLVKGGRTPMCLVGIISCPQVQGTDVSSADGLLWIRKNYGAHSSS